MKPTKEPPAAEAGDVVLQEIWRIKDARWVAKQKLINLVAGVKKVRGR